MDGPGLAGSPDSLASVSEPFFLHTLIDKTTVIPSHHSRLTARLTKTHDSRVSIRGYIHTYMRMYRLNMGTAPHQRTCNRPTAHTIWPWQALGTRAAASPPRDVDRRVPTLRHLLRGYGTSSGAMGRLPAQRWCSCVGRASGHRNGCACLSGTRDRAPHGPARSCNAQTAHSRTSNPD